MGRVGKGFIWIYWLLLFVIIMRSLLVADIFCKLVNSFFFRLRLFVGKVREGNKRIYKEVFLSFSFCLVF